MRSTFRIASKKYAVRRTTLTEVRDVIRSLGIPRSPVIMIHSSLAGLGLIEDGLPGLYRCLTETLGSDATILMPTFSFRFGQSRHWDYWGTPSETGALTEYMRKLPETVRTIHPFHSVCGAGRYHARFAACENASSFGPDSPFQLLYDMDALNLSLGAPFVGGATFLHHVEEVLKVPYRASEDFPGNVYDRFGRRVDRTFCMYARIQTAEYQYVNVWDHVWEDLCNEGLFVRTVLGAAPIHLCRIRKTHDSFARHILADPFYAADLG